MTQYLKRLNITSFRGFKFFDFDGFKPITIIGGYNNSGKSSLLEALCYLGRRESGLTPAQLTLQRGDKATPKIVTSLFYGGNNEGEIIISGEFSDGTKRGVVFECTHRIMGEFGLQDVPDEIANLNAEPPYAYAQQFYIERTGNTINRGVLMMVFSNDGFKVYPLDPSKSDASEFKQVDGIESKDDWRCALYGSRFRDPPEIFARLFSTGREKILLSHLSAIDSRITNVVFDGEYLLVDIGHENPIRLPVHVMGDGLVKMAVILSLMAVAPKGGLLCLDEVENGLHHTVMQKFWKAIITFAREQEIQIVATTHNIEMMEAITRKVIDNAINDFSFLNLARNTSDEVIVTPYNFDEFESHLNNGIDMR